MKKTLYRLGVSAVIFASVGCATVPRSRAAAPDLVALDGALANRFVPAGARSEVVARLRVSVPSTASLRRPALNLALVIDTSGSMEGRAIEDARAASRALVESLRDGDRLAVVTFDARAEVLLPSTVINTTSRATALQRVATLQARGTTAMAEGLRLGVVEAVSHLDAQGINRVVLLGDGVPNDAAGIVETAAMAGARGVTITALGLGLDYDETLMGTIAQRSGGRFHYVEDSSAVAAVFRDEVLRMERVVGRNAVARLVPGPGVEIESVVGVNATRTDEGVVVPLGDVVEGAQRDLVVRMTAPSRRAGSSVELLDVVLRYQDAVGGGGELERRAFLGARASADPAERDGGRDPEVERTAATQQLAAGTLAAIREARSGQVALAQQRLEAAMAQADDVARRQNNPELARRVTSLRQLRGALPSVAPSLPSAPAPEAPAAAAVRSAHGAAMSDLGGS